MWRLPAAAITRNDSGPYEAQVNRIELRRGDRYARIDVQGVQFDIPTDDPTLSTESTLRVSIDATLLETWRAS